MKTIHTYLVFAALWALTACQNPGGDGQQAEPPVTAPDTLIYKYKTYEKRSEHIVKTTETTDTSFFRATYPVFADDTLNQFVKSSVIVNDNPDKVYTTLEEAGEAFIRDFDQFYPKDPYPRVWTSEINARVKNITPAYLALEVQYYNYTGGAHGNHGTMFTNYDLAMHGEVRLHDIIPDEYRKELNAVAERYFRKNESLPDTASLKNVYFFEDGLFTVTENFTLLPDCLHFLYNVYEIKPYVAGVTRLSVPYSDLERMLSPRAKKLIASLNEREQ